MIAKCKISSGSGTLWRVTAGGMVSGPLPCLRGFAEDETVQPALIPGDTVAVAFFSASLADGVILGRIEEG